MPEPILPPKAESVDKTGKPDGFQPPLLWQAQVLDGGMTRLLVSAPPAALAPIHKALVAAMRAPLRVLYRQLTDRKTGQHPKPMDFVGVEISHQKLADALDRFGALVYHDGRHQLWVKGEGPEQIVLEETGLVYAYPDDPAYRDALLGLGVPERKGTTMDTRDYVKVNFVASADQEEVELRRALGLVRW